jgi:hypothetical protein
MGDMLVRSRQILGEDPPHVFSYDYGKKHYGLWKDPSDGNVYRVRQDKRRVDGDQVDPPPGYVVKFVGSDFRDGRLQVTITALNSSGKVAGEESGELQFIDENTLRGGVEIEPALERKLSGLK